ncbi:hypothetical protein [Chlorobaculum thiosulfatiphilum]|uniref:hypothetical protein n=1 Tax=Chlorobaculum thiosulfatiphilum TaxID=115852 RepID=UPI001FE39A10|nr:hypothetical protein [Chlorobaculum thiosulfatiphilum]
MDDLERAIEKRKSIDPEFAENFDKGYEEFKTGVLLKEARKNAGFSNPTFDSEQEGQPSF